ncbi:MAG: TetR/AcrR family transcriptional regulator [Sphingobium sp.]|jgi:AcrR family transcriptional regulator|nr:TetR/AcrR family transcriptional regulator [Sphingobium sp.]MCI1754652.1 TetR/AcrR family transcriptional regulator [Sphingobium sp.]MCI2054192.1 TetR/AcrR family transcriptional regulator [Sphingobium sp.]
MPDSRISLPKNRKLRADAERNRVLLLEAAKPVLAAKGGRASLEEIARSAAVGIGTLYRHFPNRDHLIIAVYEAEIDRLVEAADALADHPDPIEALRQWIFVFIDFIATKFGMSEAIGSLVGGHSELYSVSTERIRAAIGKLVAAAEQAGQLKMAIEPLDLLRAVAGLRDGSEDAEWQEGARRITDVLIAGMRI